MTPSCTRAHRFLFAIGLVGLALSAACHRAPDPPASGTLAGQRLATDVDSPLAKYYLEDYLPGRRTDPASDAAIAEALRAEPGDPFDRERLRRLSRRISTDFAAIDFVARLYDVPENRRLQDEFQSWMDRLIASDPDAVAIPEDYRSYLLVFVPGYAWRMDPSTGADFARQRRLLNARGFVTHLVETDEIGNVEENAAIVADTLLRLSETHDRIIVISTSKAGPEVALALGELLPAPKLAPVRAWISIGGLLRGTPHADRWNRWPLSWGTRMALPLWGYEPDIVPNLTTRVRTDVFNRLRFPPHLLLLQYIGAPLSGQIGPVTEDRYRRLRPLGPNDGLTLLADELIPGGRAITALGLDHFYRHPQIDLVALALATTVMGELQRASADPRETPIP